MIPRIVHQIWVAAGDGSPEPPPYLAEATRSWQDLGGGWTYRLWDDDALQALFAERWPDLLELYRWYPYAVQKSDAGRYILLHEFGGIYADVDVERAGPLPPLERILAEHELVLAPTEPLGVAADLVMAVPGHPVIRRALGTLPKARRIWHRPWVPRHFRCMAGTGPIHLTFAARRHRPEDGAPVRFLSAGEYGHGTEEEALVRHLPGNTWAGRDTYAFLFIAEHAVALAVAAVVTVMVLWLAFR